MLGNEICCLIRKKDFLVRVIGIGFMKFLAVFSADALTARMIFMDHIYSVFSILGLDMDFNWSNFIQYSTLCLCSYGLSTSVVEDMQNSRFQFIFPRSGILKYVTCKIGSIFIVSFFCMLCSDLVYLLLGHCIGNLPVFPGTGDYSWSGDILLNSDRYLLYWILKEVSYCTFGVFISYLTMVVSLYVMDRKFVTILPVIYMYFIMYVLLPERLNWTTIWVCPKSIYLREGFFSGTVAMSLFSLCYTVLIAIISGWILFIRLIKWRR